MKNKMTRDNTDPERSDHHSRKKHHSRLRSGRITKNPFLNFLREVRKNAKGMTMTEIASKGGELWRRMDSQQKLPYHQMAKDARKMADRTRRPGRKSRRRSTSRRKSANRSRSRRSSSRRRSRSRK